MARPAKYMLIMNAINAGISVRVSALGFIFVLYMPDAGVGYRLITIYKTAHSNADGFCIV